MALNSAGSTLRRISSLPPRIIRSSTPRRFSFIGTKREMRRTFAPAWPAVGPQGTDIFKTMRRPSAVSCTFFDHFDQGPQRIPSRPANVRCTRKSSRISDRPPTVRFRTPGVRREPLCLSSSMLRAAPTTARSSSGAGRRHPAQSLLSPTSDQLSRHVIAIAPPVLHCSLRVIMAHHSRRTAFLPGDSVKLLVGRLRCCAACSFSQVMLHPLPEFTLENRLVLPGMVFLLMRRTSPM